MAGITWLHLSDWHQGKSDFNRKRVRDLLVEDIQRRQFISAELKQIDFIVFTGDIANQAQDAEYGAAMEELFLPVIKAAGVTCHPEGNKTVFLVPGNHDISWSQLPEAVNNCPIDIHDGRGLVTKLNDYLSESVERSQLLQPFSAYSKFVFDHFRREERGQNKSAAYVYAKSLSLEGKTIAIVGLNSAILAARNRVASEQVRDYGYLALTEKQITDALAEVSGADIKIALMHHPLSWLVEEDRVTVQDLLSNHFDFILHGHEHMPRVEVTNSTLGNHVVIPAGSSYAGRYPDNPRYINAYNFVHLDFNSSQATVYLRRWHEINPRWSEDTDSAPNGRMVFPIPVKGQNPGILQVNPPEYLIPGTNKALNPYPLNMMLEPEEEEIDRRHRYTKITWEVTVDKELNYRGKYTFAGTNTSEDISSDLIIPLTAIGAFEIQDLSPSVRDLQKNHTLQYSLLPHLNRHKFMLQIRMNSPLKPGDNFNIQLEFCLPKVMYRADDFDAIGLRRFPQGVRQFEYFLETPYVLVEPRFFTIRETSPSLQDLGVTVTKNDQTNVYRVTKIVGEELLQDPATKGLLFYYVRLEGS